MKDFPSVSIAHLPTRVEALPRLSAELGGPQIWVKRDDQTGLAFGGNKTRKLELLIAEALREGAQTLLTSGAVQSNHCRQTAAAAARFGLRCVLILAGEKAKELSANNLLDRLLGAEIIWVPIGERDEALQKAFDVELAAGRKPYKVPYGGSSPLGAAPYALAIDELKSQDEQMFDRIVFASSSGGTQAGMVAGAKIFDYPAIIHGISVDEEGQIIKARVAELASAIADLMKAEASFRQDEILVSDDYLGAGYAVMGALESEAIHLFARLEGLILDPVYTGRAAGAMIDLIRKGEIEKNEKVLFWHTGGQPAIFAPNFYHKLIE